jgi:hypothetical protein
LSGVVFLLCCEMPIAQASNVESCPLAKTQHCSKRSSIEVNTDFALLQTRQPAFDCCSFLSLVFDKARKIEKTQKIVAIQTNVKAFQPVFSIVNRQILTPKNFHSFIVSQENIHIKNCVFRI